MKSERRGKFEKPKGKALIFVILFAILAFVSAGIGCASAATIYVPDNYSPIQQTVNAANIGNMTENLNLSLEILS